MHAFRDLETVAYCPRKLYYRRREGVPSIPNEVATVRSLAFEYERLREDDAALLAAPIEVDPATYRERLDRASERLDAWDVLASPPARDVLLTGREARGVAHKVIEEPLAPSLAFAGQPPDEGVWEPQTVRLVAAAKALSWERETPVDRKAAYRRAVRTADRVGGPPPRLDDEAKCRPCEYSEECGTTTRSLKSLLSL